MPPMSDGADRVVLDGTELAMLLGGFDLAASRRLAAWTPTKRQRLA